MSFNSSLVSSLSNNELLSSNEYEKSYLLISAFIAAFIMIQYHLIRKRDVCLIICMVYIGTDTANTS